jgi:hypothetical protein
LISLAGLDACEKCAKRAILPADCGFVNDLFFEVRAFERFVLDSRDGMALKGIAASASW